MHITIPQLGLGTFRLKDGQAIDAVATGLELGYRHIDTAQSERLVDPDFAPHWD